MSELPPEVLERILAYVKCPRDLHAAACVSRLWRHEVARELDRRMRSLYTCANNNPRVTFEFNIKEICAYANSTVVNIVLPVSARQLERSCYELDSTARVLARPTSERIVYPWYVRPACTFFLMSCVLIPMMILLPVAVAALYILLLEHDYVTTPQMTTSQTADRVPHVRMRARPAVYVRDVLYWFLTALVYALVVYDPYKK